MPDFAAVRPDHVQSAIAEHDRLGPVAFREHYGFGPAREYLLWHDGRPYDSKAILGGAMKFAVGRPARASSAVGRMAQPKCCAASASR